MVEVGILDADDRTELLNGHIVEMTAQNAAHRAVIVEANKLFVIVLQETGYSVQVQSTLPLDDNNVPEPDLAIFRGSGNDLLEGEPDEIPLIVEVADTSLETDRTTKLRCYATNDIPEYWIINLRSETVEVYREPAEGEYRRRETMTRGERMKPLFDNALSLDISDLLPARQDTGSE